MRKVMLRGVELLLTGCMMAFCLNGCGSRPANEPEKQTVTEETKQPEKGTAARQTKMETAKEKTGTADEKNENGQETMYTASGIPVYGEGEKEAIKEYLLGFPDRRLSVEEMKEFGVIGGTHNRILYSKKENHSFDEEWYKFLTVINKGEALEKDRKQGKAVHDISIFAAVVLLSYTTEGDPVYDYISYIDGKYYLYTDYSRDKFGGGEFFGSYEEMVEDRDAQGKAVQYYLLSEENVSKDKWKKWLDSENGNVSKKIIGVYQLEDETEVTAIYNN